VIIAFIPVWLLKHLADDEPGRRRWNVVGSHLVLLVGLLMLPAFAGRLSAVPHTCLMQWAVGLPCPGCGITTSMNLLAQFRLRAALAANPAGPLLVVGIILQILLHTFRPAQPQWRDSASQFIGLICLMGLFTIWLARLVS
jgi:hypothetical protein